MFSGGFGGFGGFGGMSSQQQSPAQKKQVNTTQYYQLLGVDKKATAQQIRKSFRKKALKQHPDKGGDPDKFKRITNAYQTLTNPQKRQLYDEYGQQGVQNGGPPGGSGGFGDIFSFFGGGGRKQSGPRKAKPKLIEVEVNLNDVYNGCMKNVEIQRYRNCQQCDGKGGKNVEKCTKCKGQGLVTKLVQLGPGMYSQTQQKCADCKGNGQTMKQQDRCKSCTGDKIRKVKKTLQVAIQKGVPDYHDYIFTGQSDQGPGIIAGDIYARVRIKQHKVFQRRGADLVIIKKISLLEALTGVTFQIEHLDGKKYTIATAPGQVISNGELKTVKNLGMPFYKDGMSNGNLYIEFLVDFPSKNWLKPQITQKLTKILGGMQTQKPSQSKKIQRKIIEQYDQADLNQSPQGGKVKQDYSRGRGGAQQVKCQSQ